MSRETVTANEYGEIVSCVCGNQSHISGFYACNPVTGQEVEPDNSWDGKSYVCADCGRVTDQTTLGFNPDPDRDFEATHVLTVNMREGAST